MGTRNVAAEGAAPGIAIRVFLADGNDYFRVGLRDLLRSHDGIEVVGTCSDHREAPIEVARLQPDVVVHDLTTPHVDADQAAALIRALSAFSRVILLSLNSTTEHVLHAIDAGACGYLLKNGAAEEIVEAVRAVHGGRLYLSRRIADLLAGEYLRHAPSRATRLH